ncbi:hypothetical protein V1273_006722 [Bradyrhizobium sp. AZCC 1721]
MNPGFDRLEHCRLVQTCLEPLQPAVKPPDSAHHLLQQFDDCVHRVRLVQCLRILREARNWLYLMREVGQKFVGGLMNV